MSASRDTPLETPRDTLRDTFRDTPDFLWLVLHRLGLTGAQARQWLAVDPAADVAHWLATPIERWPLTRLTDTSVSRWRDWRRRGRASAVGREAAADRQWLRAHGARLLHLAAADYPALLREIADPPPWLYLQGEAEVLQEPQLAVVGSRKPSASGLGDASAFAAELATAGFVVTSGLAVGIDAAAHRGALAASGRTVAVLGSGLDRLYPAQHRALARQIVDSGGALLSELPLGTPPRPAQFPSRNRIISGLSLGVLVVEAALRSGSLVTARLALEQNREVFALPGSIHNPASRGCNALIRQGAVLVTEVADIVAELGGWLLPQSSAQPQVVAAESDSPLLAALGFEPTPIDLLVERLQLPVPALLVALGDLELDGLVEQRGGAWLRCRPA